MKKMMITSLLLCAGLLCCLVSGARAWEAPVIDAPYDHQFQDERRMIAVNRIVDGDTVYFVADVQLSSASDFRTWTDPGMAPVSVLAQQAGAVLAINGDDYATHKYGVIIRNGALLRAHNTTRNLLCVDAQGDMSVRIDRKGEDSKALGKQLTDSGALQTFEFGPVLVQDGQAAAFSKNFDLISTRASRLEPRTAIGQVGPLHYVIIVADGRQEGYSAGMSLPRLQELFLGFGAQTAMNLDGGGSSEIWFQGEILNRPAGGEERYVSDILCF